LFQRERSLHEGRRFADDLLATRNDHRTPQQQAEYERRQAAALPAYVRALREAQPVKVRAGVAQNMTRRGRRATMADGPSRCEMCNAPVMSDGQYSGTSPASALACSQCGAPVRHVPMDDAGPINSLDDVDADEVDADEGMGDADALEELEDAGQDTSLAGPGSGRAGRVDIAKMKNRANGQVACRDASGSPTVLLHVQRMIRQQQRRRLHEKPVI
jgi:hypothetical protein